MNGKRVIPYHEALGAVRILLEYLGEDPDREGLVETPKRVIKAYEEMLSGYTQDPKDLIKTFKDGVCDELVILKDIGFNSLCEHHVLPFSGVAHVGYIPNKEIIGLSKLARIVDLYSKRLQVQERLGVQITKALMEFLKPKGCGCIIKANHSCMSCRGVNKQNSTMITSSLEGVFKTDPKTRSEFLELVRS